MIDLKEGDVFEGGYEAIINPVNCKGNNNIGFAALVEEKYPANQDLYELHCKVPDKHKEKLKIGNIYQTFHIISHEPYKFLFIVNMAVIGSQKDKVKVDDIKSCLDQIGKFLAANKAVKSIAIPAVEGIDFQEFYQLVAEKLGGVECKIDVYNKWIK